VPATQPSSGPDRLDDGAGDALAEATVEDRGHSTVDWDGLPDPVRQRLAAFAAAALPGLAAAEVPPPVRPVARFAPAKRARLGAPVLVAGLRDFPAFRVAVAGWMREHRPEELTSGGTDPVTAASAAVLLGEPGAGERVAEVGRRAEEVQLRSERDAALARAERLTAEVRRLQRELAEARAGVQQAGTAGEAEAERLRGRLREQGVRLRQAQDESARAAGAHHAEIEELRRALGAATADRDRERERVAAARRQAVRAVADAETARHTAREARQADEVRLSLLVDTLAGAVSGLRHELGLGRELGLAQGPGGGSRPADLVRGASTSSAVAGRVADPAALDRLLALPTVHLVVDGYNVTKTGYPDLTLSAQRDRLAAALAALAARTGAEVTVVFDGAAVVAVPLAASRGVRVLFSDPGVLADDVIRSIVAAEPAGRPLVVVTTDREVADSVRRQGAYPVPSAVLLARLNRI